MSEMIERAARALCETAGYDPDKVMGGPLKLGDTHRAIAWQVYVPEAEAALQAALDPSDEALVDVVAKEMWRDDPDPDADTWERAGDQEAYRHGARLMLRALRTACSVPPEPQSSKETICEP